MFFCTCPQVLALPTELTGPGSDRAPGYTSVRRGGRQGERAGPDVGVCACHVPQASQGEGSGGQQWGELGRAAGTAEHRAAGGEGGRGNRTTGRCCESHGGGWIRAVATQLCGGCVLA